MENEEYYYPEGNLRFEKEKFNKGISQVDDLELIKGEMPFENEATLKALVMTNLKSVRSIDMAYMYPFMSEFQNIDKAHFK
jgi:hypothetical protein